VRIELVSCDNATRREREKKNKNFLNWAELPSIGEEGRWRRNYWNDKVLKEICSWDERWAERERERGLTLLKDVWFNQYSSSGGLACHIHYSWECIPSSLYSLSVTYTLAMLMKKVSRLEDCVCRVIEFDLLTWMRHAERRRRSFSREQQKKSLVLFKLFSSFEFLTNSNCSHRHGANWTAEANNILCAPHQLSRWGKLSIPF
jgi:hypothetical protein